MNNLVFLAGASGNTQFWYPLVAQLPKTYTKQVIAYPSFHGVAAHPDINSFDDLSDYVVEQIQQPSILIAQSMGGIFAIKGFQNWVLPDAPGKKTKLFIFIL